MSRVTDPLREYIAKTWDGSMYVNQVPMRLLEIADQIDTEQERLEQGNARLRELVRDMWHEGAFQPGACYVYEAERLEERTRELGIEVDE